MSAHEHARQLARVYRAGSVLVFLFGATFAASAAYENDYATAIGALLLGLAYGGCLYMAGEVIRR